MPPRYAYWTILVDEQPTAFRAADLADLQPTFKRLKAKHPSARMVWFQNGKVWNSRLDAQEAMRVRGDRGRARDFRQRATLRERPAAASADGRDSKGKLEWKPRPKTQDPRPKTQAPRPTTWRPGGEHRDPRQKYKDARKAKWTRFKQTVRKRWEAKQDRKKRDDE